jgi:hypothetical protein
MSTVFFPPQIITYYCRSIFSFSEYIFYQPLEPFFLDILFPLGSNWSGSYQIYRSLSVLGLVQGGLPTQELINPITIEVLTFNWLLAVLGPCPFIFFFVPLINYLSNY